MQQDQSIAEFFYHNQFWHVYDDSFLKLVVLWHDHVGSVVLKKSY